MRTISLVLAVILFSGCATIIRPSSDVTIDSEPKGLHCEVFTEGNSKVTYGTTPYKANLKNNTDMYVKCENGARQEIETELNPWFWGDIALLSLLAIIIDGVSGNWTQQTDTIVRENVI